MQKLYFGAELKQDNLVLKVDLKKRKVLKSNVKGKDIYTDALIINSNFKTGDRLKMLMGNHSLRTTKLRIFKIE